MSKQKGDLLIHYIWQIGTASIHYMRFINTDVLYHHNKLTEKCLLMEEKIKERKYLEDCLRKCRHLSPLVISTDDILRVEAEADLKLIASYLTTKWKHLYSRTSEYVNSRA